MKRALILSFVIFLNCNTKNESNRSFQEFAIDSLVPLKKKILDTLSKQPEPDTLFQNIPLHNIKYGDFVRTTPIELTLDTTHVEGKCSKHFSFLVNSIDQRILRYSMDAPDWKVKGACLEDVELNWEKVKGRPTEFIGDYLFTSYLKGHPSEGTITKFKYKISGADLRLVDSLSGGFYSEGAGSWEWVLSKKGKPIGIAFFDVFEDMNDSLMLIRSEIKPERYIINTNTLDTVARLPTPKHVWKAYLCKDKIVYNYWVADRYYLSLVNTKGDPLWTVNTDFNYEMILDLQNNLIIASVLERDKKEQTSIVAYDIEHDKPLWNFSISKTFKHNRRVSDLFQIRRGYYGALIGESQLIIFNSIGEVVKAMDLASSKGRREILKKDGFTFVSEGENQFLLVSSTTTIRFKLSDN